MASARHWEQDKDATVYVGNLDERVTDKLIWELMTQAGRVVNVHLPKDRVTGTHQGYGFVEFNSEIDAEYASKIMNQIRMYNKPIRVNKASADKQKTVDIGAELFIGNLDSMVDERALYETFSRFGTLLSPPKIARDEANLSKGYGFVSYADFESSDTAIESMNGYFFMNKEITVQYAYKKDGKGERHGDEAERLLAAQARKNGVMPVVQPMPTHFIQQPVAPPPATAANGTPVTPGFAPNAGYGNMPPPPHHHQQRPPPQPLAPPPAGANLPSRPPPSQAGYGGPSGMPPPPTFGGQMPMPPPGAYQQPNGLQPQFPPPPGPHGFAPPPPGMPPGMMPPPGMQHPGYPGQQNQRR